MSSIQTNALSLHEILLSIADSLNKAQNQLRSMPPYDEFGRPNTIYQLPYLDFNLEVVSEFTGSGLPDKPLEPLEPLLPGDPEPSREESSTRPAPKTYLKFVPLAPTDYSKAGSNKITSVISGRFVAILPNDGLPQVYVSTQATLVGAPTTVATYRIVVRLQDATGAPLDGRRVEVNFDEQTSLSINVEELETAPVFTSPKDGFTGIGAGNNPGEFAVTVELGLTDYNAGNTFIFVANSGNIFSSVAISNS
jgi:hypothetical protein